jgi:hypothetical protein
MKKPEVLLKEYVGKLSDDNLTFLHVRFDQRLQGDLAESLDFLAKTSDMDRWLNTAKSAEDFGNLVDLVSDYVVKEYKKRYKKEG